MIRFIENWSKQHWVLLAIFLVFATLFNGLVFYFQSKSIQEVTHQVRILSRRHLLSGDTATARELLQSLTPNYLSDFQFSDSLNNCSKGLREIPVYFDEMRTSFHSSVCVAPNSEVFFRFLVFGNVLLMLAFGLSWYFNDRYQKQLLLTTEARIDSHRQMAQVAEQVFHDIRSPIAALRTLQGSAVQLTEPLRILLRNAITRIEEITDQMQLKTLSDEVERESVSLESISLWSVVDRVVAEKNLFLRNRKGVSIEKEVDSSAYSLFGWGKSGELSRILSNVINNSLEAIEEAGRVTIRVLAVEKESVAIEVVDTGGGVPDSVKERLFQRGCTSKKEGSGLGLYHGLKTVTEWGGNITLQSGSSGTSVLISLKKASAPGWFPTVLQVQPGMPVVVVDDDTSIHDVWQYRLQGFGLKLVHLFSLEKLDEYVVTCGKQALFLVDHELVGGERSGLDCIRAHGIQPVSLLVTSRYSDSQIVSKCIDEKVRLLPKFLAGAIPIELEPNYILVDDDPLVRQVWSTSAKTHGKHLTIYRDRTLFLNDLSSLDVRASLYVDRLLGSDDGLELADEAFSAGFRDIHLTTGLPSVRNEVPRAYIKSVIDKRPPWTRA